MLKTTISDTGKLRIIADDAVIELRTKRGYPFTYETHRVTYVMGELHLFGDWDKSGKWTLTQSDYTILGEFPERTAMTKWVKKHFLRS